MRCLAAGERLGGIPGNKSPNPFTNGKWLKARRAKDPRLVGCSLRNEHWLSCCYAKGQLQLVDLGRMYG